MLQNSPADDVLLRPLLGQGRPDPGDRGPMPHLDPLAPPLALRQPTHRRALERPPGASRQQQERGPGQRRH